MFQTVCSDFAECMIEFVSIPGALFLDIVLVKVISGHDISVDCRVEAYFGFKDCSVEIPL